MHCFRFWSLHLFRAPFSPSVPPVFISNFPSTHPLPISFFFPSLQFNSLFSSFSPSPLFPHFPFSFLIQVFPFHLTHFLHLFPQHFYNLLVSNLSLATKPHVSTPLNSLFIVLGFLAIIHSLIPPLLSAFPSALTFLPLPTPCFHLSSLLFPVSPTPIFLLHTSRIKRIYFGHRL